MPPPRLSPSGRSCLIAVLLAAGLQSWLWYGSPVVSPDAVVYLQMAQRLPEAPVETVRQSDQHPGYPAMIVGMRWMVGQAVADRGGATWLGASRLVCWIAGLFCVGLVWRLSVGAVGPAAAAWSVAIFAVLPVARGSAVDVLADTPHLCLFLAALVCGQQAWTTGHSRWFAAAGGLSGLAFWVRPEGLLAAAGVGAVLVWRMVRPAGNPRLETVRQASCLGTAVLVLLVPYFACKGEFSGKVSAKFRQPASSVTGETASAAPAKAHEPPPAPVPAPEVPVEGAGFFDRLGSGVGYSVTRLAEALRGIPLVLLLVGLAAGTARRGPEVASRWVTGCAFLAACVLLVAVAGYLSHRHLLPLIGVLMPTIGLGASRLAAARRNGSAPKRIPREFPRERWAVAALIVMLVVGLVPRCLRPLNHERLHFVEATRWLDKEAAPGAPILTNDPFFAAHLKVVQPDRSPTLLDVDRRPDLLHSRQFRWLLLQWPAEPRTSNWMAMVSERYEPAFSVAGDRGRPPLVVFQARTPPAHTGSRSTQMRR